MDDFHVQPISFNRAAAPEPNRAINESQAISEEGGGGNAGYGQSGRRGSSNQQDAAKEDFEDYVAPEVIERARERRRQEQSPDAIPLAKINASVASPTTPENATPTIDQPTVTAVNEPHQTATPKLRFNNGEGTSIAVLDHHEIQALRAERLDVELLTTGPLPGPASLWISQYADHLARRSGVAALLRLSETDLEIELFFGDSQPRPQKLRDLIANPLILRGTEERAEAQSQFTQTLELLATHISHWAIHIDQPEQVWPDLASWAPKWAILTGADQAAAVAAYRRIKTLIMDSDEQGRAQPDLRVMFLGCAVQQANDAATRIHRAAATFLDTPIEWAGFRQRMNPLKRSQILSAETKANHLSDRLEEFLVQQSQMADLKTPAPAESTPIQETVHSEFDDFAQEIMEGAEDTPDIDVLIEQDEQTDQPTEQIPAEPEIVISEAAQDTLNPPSEPRNEPVNQPPLSSIPTKKRSTTHPPRTR